MVSQVPELPRRLAGSADLPLRRSGRLLRLRNAGARPAHSQRPHLRLPEVAWDAAFLGCTRYQHLDQHAFRSPPSSDRVAASIHPFCGVLRSHHIDFVSRSASVGARGFFHVSQSRRVEDATSIVFRWPCHLYECVPGSGCCRSHR